MPVIAKAVSEIDMQRQCSQVISDLNFRYNSQRHIGVLWATESFCAENFDLQRPHMKAAITVRVYLILGMKRSILLFKKIWALDY